MLNKATLIGRLGNDPETKHLPNGSAVTNISLATTRRWKNKESGEKQEETEWHRITFFNRLAEIASEYLRKGSLVYIEGRIKADKWKDDKGNDRYSTGIIADQLQMLSSKSDANSNAAGQQNERPSPQDYEDFDDAAF